MQASLETIAEQMGPVPERERWPSVSIVIPTRDGRNLLEALLTGLGDQTDYDPFDVVVVDNGSSDGTVEWLPSAAVAVRVLAMGRNTSFSESCNRGAAACAGELVLFLNNDIEPLEPGWLKRLVTSLDASAAAAAGAVLVDPAMTTASGSAAAVHHRAIVFRPAPRLGVLQPRPHGAGAEVGRAVEPDRRVAAATAACLLVRRSAFESVLGFCEDYRYGKEDVDLCLKLHAAGHAVVSSGSTVLLHRRGATRRASAFGSTAAMDDNLRILVERWGPRLRREHAADVSAGAGVWSDGDVAGPAGVTYRVATGDGEAEAAEAFASALRDAGRAAAVVDDGLAWLMDDVVVHLGAPPARTVAGRVNVLVTPEPERVPRRERLRFMIVCENTHGAARVAEAVETELAARGGPGRVNVAAAPIVPPRAILVLGMARTGTSATTRLLNLCGIEVGPEENLMPANADVNAKGFYEHFPLEQINVALLRRLGGSWKELPPLPSGWELDPSFEDLRRDARAIIAKDFGRAHAWAFKDPRTCILLPFWRPLLGAVDYVICHRHPLEVADSLASRDGVPIVDGVRLWERYTAASILHTTGARRLFVGYHEYFENHDRVVADLAAFAGTGADAGLSEQAAEWLDPSLRHHRRTHAELLAAGVGPAAVTLHLLLELAVCSRAGTRSGDAVSDALDAAARDSLRPGAHRD